MNISYPLILDGGLSNELEAQGCDLNHKLWSANLLETNPEAIIEAHLAYLHAGAQCVITSSYQASIPGLLANGFDPGTAETLIAKTVELAEEAVKRFMESNSTDYKPLIAASIGPYGAYLSDGSEYTGEYSVSDHKLRVFHISRINVLDKTTADLFACETIPCLQEAKVLLEILSQTKKQAWMTFSCKDGNHLNDGTPIRDCALLLKDHPNIFAVGVNCTAPKNISSLISSIKGCVGDKKIIVYPNSGEVYNAESKTWSNVEDPNSFVAMTEEWLELGADIIGGCCRIGPEHIRGICSRLAARN